MNQLLSRNFDKEACLFEYHKIHSFFQKNNRIKREIYAITEPYSFTEHCKKSKSCKILLTKTSPISIVRLVLRKRVQKCCPHRLAWPRTPPFHGGDGGSNPPGDVRIEKGSYSGVTPFFLYDVTSFLFVLLQSNGNFCLYHPHSL